MREASVFGIRTDHTFRGAATKLLNENQHLRRIRDTALQLRQLDPFIGSLLLRQVHRGSLQEFIDGRRAAGVKTKSINHGLAIVRHVLNLAASEWFDEQGLTWLESAPKITLLPVNDSRDPYPLNFDEQARLFRELPVHLARMALFKVNTGCREQEVCRLRWEWEVQVPELSSSVFIIPNAYVKNGEDRLVILNRVARSVIDEVRGEHAEFVFAYRGQPVTKMNNSAWKCARERAADGLEAETKEAAPWGFRHVRVHDLKHTFGRRLRAAGVSFEDRQDLLGHKSARITTHYSQAELESLITAANKVCALPSRKTPALVLLRKKTSGG
ncbi:MAG TPA: tyrosine-type recombinase/integrase [Candidatus Acidoferrales bacterium]|nr:tyrosine-type recombinase/integrase [Candidatus Acidoferrales bacterium]